MNFQPNCNFTQVKSPDQPCSGTYTNARMLYSPSLLLLPANPTAVHRRPNCASLCSGGTPPRAPAQHRSLRRLSANVRWSSDGPVRAASRPPPALPPPHSPSLPPRPRRRRRRRRRWQGCVHDGTTLEACCVVTAGVGCICRVRAY